MTTFTALATAFTSALAADFGDQLDSVFDYFGAVDDVTEDSCANIGIVTKGVPSQELKDYVAELIIWAKGVYSNGCTSRSFLSGGIPVLQAIIAR